MSKERLEELEDLFEDISNDMMPPYVGITCDTVVDVKWVIKYAKEQAERVQELERDYKFGSEQMDLLIKDRDLKTRQNKRYREALQVISDVEHIEKCLDEEIVQVARKALEESE